MYIYLYTHIQSQYVFLVLIKADKESETILRPTTVQVHVSEKLQ